MKRLLWTVIGIMVLVASLVALVAAPMLGILALDVSVQQLGGAGGAGEQAAAKPTPSPTATPTPLDPIIYGGQYLDGKDCFDVAQTPVAMVKQDFGWSKDALSSKYQTEGDGVTAPVIFLCNDYWPWKTPTHLTVSQVLTSLHWPADLVPQAKRQQTIEVAPTLYGARGDNGKTCLGTSGSPAKMFKLDFNLDVTTNAILTIGYAQNPRVVLCNDTWPWVATDSGPLSGTNSLQDTITRMKWPADLITERYQSFPITVKILADFDPTTAAALIENAQQEQAKQNAPTGPCDWVPDLLVSHPHINLCDPIKGLIRATAEGLCETFTSAQNAISFLWTTSTDPFTDEDSGLPGFWRLSWGLVIAFLAAVVAWMGIRIMAGAATSWLSYASVLEVLPRLIVALLTAYFSRELLLGLISANNAFAKVFADVTIKTLLTEQASDTAAALLQIIYAAMAFLLIVEEAARMAVLYLLFAFAPLLMFCAALRETEGVARASVIAAVLFAFLQAMQLAVLDVGGQIISSVLTRSAGVLMTLQLLAGIAILYITLMLFFSVTRVALGSVGMPFGSGVLWASTGMMGGIARSMWRNRTEGGQGSSSSEASGSGSKKGGAGAPSRSTLAFGVVRSLLVGQRSSASSSGSLGRTSGATTTGGATPSASPGRTSSGRASGNARSARSSSGASGGGPSRTPSSGQTPTSRSVPRGSATGGSTSGGTASGGAPTGGKTSRGSRPPGSSSRPSLRNRPPGGTPPRSPRGLRPPQWPRP